MNIQHQQFTFPYLSLTPHISEDNTILTYLKCNVSSRTFSPHLGHLRILTEICRDMQLLHSTFKTNSLLFSAGLFFSKPSVISIISFFVSSLTARPSLWCIVSASGSVVVRSSFRPASEP